jgi:hypothetical protein
MKQHSEAPSPKVVMRTLHIVDCVQKDCHGLPDDAERDPKDDVAQRRSGIPAVQLLSEGDERNLPQHKKKAPWPNDVKGDRNKDLVHHGRQKEHDESCRRPRDLPSQAGKIDVPDQKIMNGSCREGIMVFWVGESGG